MPAAQVKSLALRKQAILLEAALHRARLAQSQSRISHRIGALRRQVLARRWWLVGAAVGAGLVAARASSSRRLVLSMLAPWRMLRRLFF